MNLKKLISISLALGIIVFLNACSDSNSPTEEPQNPPQEEESSVLPPLDFSNDYTQASLDASPSVVRYTQTISSVNGKSYIPLMCYGIEISDMPNIKQIGFNTIHTYQTRNRTEKEWLAYMDAAQQNGLMVFFNLDGAILTADKEAKLKRMVQCVKNHPALHSWYLADEPSKDKVEPSKLKAIYNWIKKEDSNNHPVLCSNWELNNFIDCCDVDMRQLYWGLPSRQSSALNNYLEAQNKGKKTWMAIINSHDRGWGYDDNAPYSVCPKMAFGYLTQQGYKEGDQKWEDLKNRFTQLSNDLEHPEAYGFKLTPAFPKNAEEVRGSLYWALVHGSNGLAYWLYTDPNTLYLGGWYTTFHQSALRNGIQKTLKEMATLSSYLLTPAENSNAFMSEQGLYVWSKKSNGRRIVTILNESGDAFQGSIDLAKLYITNKTLRVFNEDDRAIKLDGDMLTDSFVKEGIHIYFVE